MQNYCLYTIYKQKANILHGFYLLNLLNHPSEVYQEVLRKGFVRADFFGKLEPNLNRSFVLRQKTKMDSEQEGSESDSESRNDGQMVKRRRICADLMLPEIPYDLYNEFEKSAVDLFRLSDAAIPDSEGVVSALQLSIDQILLDVSSIDHRRPSPVELVRIVTGLYTALGGDIERPSNPIHLVFIVHRFYNVEKFGLPGVHYVGNCFFPILYRLREIIETWLKKFPNDQTLINSRIVMQTIIERFHAIHKTAEGLAAVQIAYTPGFSVDCAFDPPPNTDNMKDFAKCVYEIRRACGSLQLRLQNGNLMRPVIRDREFKHAFEIFPKDDNSGECMTVEEFVKEKFPNMPEFDRTVRTISSQRSAVDQIGSENDPLLPFLYRNWDHVSFLDGVYNIRTEEFISHDAIPCGIFSFKYHELPFDRDSWEQFNGPYLKTDRDDDALDNGEKLPICRHDSELIEFDDDPMNIPTPCLDKIFHYQFPQTPQEQELLDPSIRVEDPQLLVRFFYAMLGRLFWNLGERDNCQLTPVIMGKPGTGKSLIVTLFQGVLYDTPDVAIIARCQEPLFGLMNKYNRKIWIMTETDAAAKGTSMPVSTLKQMTVGDPMTMARKFGTAVEKRWKSPGLIVGNDLNDWQAVAGLSRRFCLLWYRRVVLEVEDLEAGLRAEAPNILLKTTRMYNRLLKYINDREIHMIEMLPNEIVKNRQNMDLESSDLDAFILYKSTDILYDADDTLAIYCPITRFMNTFKKWRLNSHKNGTGNQKMPSTQELFNALQNRYPRIRWANNGQPINLQYPRHKPGSEQTEPFIELIDFTFDCSNDEKTRLYTAAAPGFNSAYSVEDWIDKLGGLKANFKTESQFKKVTSHQLHEAYSILEQCVSWCQESPAGGSRIQAILRDARDLMGRLEAHL